MRRGEPLGIPRGQIIQEAIGLRRANLGIQFRQSTSQLKAFLRAKDRTFRYDPLTKPGDLDLLGAFCKPFQSLSIAFFNPGGRSHP